MRIKLLVATCEADYGEHLSNSISAHYADTIAVSMCRTIECLNEAIESQRVDVALLDTSLAYEAELSSVTLPLVLISDADLGTDPGGAFGEIARYQRISSIVAEVLARYAKVSKYGSAPSYEKANITAVWSPTGGVGKTSVALSYAAKKVTEGKKVLYLNLESFSSVPAYFEDGGKSISSLFEMLENTEGNIKMLVKGICRQDKGAGVAYFCRPENFDDMYALSAENIAELTTVCAGVTQELVIDMSCACDRRTRKVFDLSDRVFLVSDSTAASDVKLSQFLTQHNVFENIREKVIIVANKGAAVSEAIPEPFIQLPLVRSSDPTTVYKTLSVGFD